MDRVKTVLIGAAVMIAGLGVIFGLNAYKNKKQEAAISSMCTPETEMGSGPVDVSEMEPGTSPMNAPVMEAGSGPMDAPVMEAGSAVMPGLYTGESYLAKNEWINNPDGTVTYQGNTYKRNAHIKAILLAGIDHKNGMQSKDAAGDTGAADGIMLIAQDTSKKSIKMLLIPRDSMVEYTVSAQNGEVFSVFDHLSISFAYGDGRDESAKSLMQATSNLLCGLEINHYLAGDLALLADLNDMVGGVTVTIPGDELAKKNPEWTRGKQVTLHGDEAESFIRYRDIQVDGSPVLRMNQHQAYISGFYKALKETSGKDSAIVSKLVDKIDSSIVTDMSKGDYEKIALDALQGGFNPDKDMKSLKGTSEVGEEDGTLYDQVYLDYTDTIPLLLDLFYRRVN